MSPSKLRKTRAYTDGVCHADGGKDLRATHAPTNSWDHDGRIAYDLGFTEHSDYLEREREKAGESHPPEFAEVLASLRALTEAVRSGKDMNVNEALADADRILEMTA